MRWFNYHHLYYFWTVAKLGSVTSASHELGVAQPTVSAQLRSLEEEFGEKLFRKEGRYLRLTESGELAFQYAEKIFALGGELFDLVEGRATGKPDLLRIGISDVLPKSLAYLCIEAIYDLPLTPRVICVEDSSERLLSQLAVHQIDVVLSDCPIPPSVNVLAYNHHLGSCGISFLATADIAKRCQKDFPASLRSVPLLIPTPHAAVRMELERWFARQELSLLNASEFQDSALMKHFGSSGRGVFPVPTVVEKAVLAELDLKVVGRIEEPLEHFYLISTEKRVKHPAIAQMCARAQEHLFK